MRAAVVMGVVVGTEPGLGGCGGDVAGGGPR